MASRVGANIGPMLYKANVGNVGTIEPLEEQLGRVVAYRSDKHVFYDLALSLCWIK